MNIKSIIQYFFKRYHTKKNTNLAFMKELRLNNRSLWMMRPYTNADYSQIVILTKSVFNFVEAWILKEVASGRLTDKKPLHYWHQAKHYYEVGTDLRSEVKPLMNYYCCLNTVKCLLSVLGQDVRNIKHGVSWEKSQNINLDDQKIKFLGVGALKGLRTIIGKDDGEHTFSLKTLLYNLVVVHRAYVYTFDNEPEIFIPIKSLKFYYRGSTDKITIAFDLKKDIELSVLKTNIPSCFQFTTKSTSDWVKVRDLAIDEKLKWGIENDKIFFRYKNEKDWDESKPTPYKQTILTKLHNTLRPYFQYIISDSPIWYLKKEDNLNPNILNYSSTVISYAIMHCLSEMVRYAPDLYKDFLESEYSWLISEFVEVGMDQFIDEIASQITGLNIMRSGVKGKC